MIRGSEEWKRWRAEQDAFYASGVWVDCARAYRQAHPWCERCLKEHRISASEEVHHKIELTAGNINDPDVALNWENLEALCGKCHRQEHGKKRGGRRWSVDEKGNVAVT